MKAKFTCEPNPAVERLRVETEAAFRRADAERVLERMTIATTMAPIAHGFGGVPRWRLFNQEGIGNVYQTQPADRTYLYLEASTQVTVSIELF